MLSLDRILLPVDFSGRCHGAAHYADALIRHFHSELTVLHVLPPPHYEFSAMEVGGPVLEELYRNRRQHAEQEMTGFVSEELAGYQVTSEIVEGDPAREIVEFAHQRKMDLIMMPTHGYGPFRRFILGSVTAKVLHDADCPVWTGVHLEETPKKANISLGTIAVALDLGPQTEKTLGWAGKLADELRSRLLLIHATPTLEGRTGEYFDPDWRKHLAAAAREGIEEIQRKVGIKAEVVIDSGDAATTVCELAEANKAELLIIGRGSAAGVFGRLRANAYTIIRQSKCPVVSV